MRSVSKIELCFCAILVFSVVGCSGRTKPAAAPAAHHHVHGPHDGELIELGNEEYHAELFNDDEHGVVTIYILDKEGKQPVPITEEAITINMKSGAGVAEFRLPSKPQESDSPGKSSRFESDQKDLRLALDNPEAVRELHVKIDGKTYAEKFPYYEPEQHHHDANH